MAEPQAATETKTRGGADAERTRGDGPQASAERATWTEAGQQRAKQAAEQQAAAAEKASEVLRDWTSTMQALYARNMSMASCRSRALADYWEELSRARQPADVLNAGTSFWSRMVNDYSNFTVGEGGMIKDLMSRSRPDR
jgi:hypothetical protein